MAAVLCVAGVVAAGPTSAADHTASEHAVKAAIIYKIAKFVSWPNDVAAGGEGVLPICVAKRDPIGPAMDALAGKTVQGRKIEIRRFEDTRTLTSDCAILFLSEAASLPRPRLVSDVANYPVLTIGDSEDFAEIGGIVTLEVRKNRVQFAISMGASDRAGLNISAQLLQLAKLRD